MNRIKALDMLRGFALLSIMLNHMPISVARNVTLSNYFLFDAAELFVLLSGFLVGLVWWQVSTRNGTGAAQKRFAIRAWQVWRAMLIGAVLMAALSALLLWFGLRHTAVWLEYGRMLMRDPLQYVIDVGGLWMQPNLIDVLALYVILIALVPLVMPAIARWPWVVAAVLFAIWMAAVPLNQMIPNQRPGKGGFLFNPFGWQVLFFTGAAMGYYRREVLAMLAPYARAMTVIAWGILLFGALVLIGWRVGEPLKPMRDFLWLFHGPIDKWSLDEARFVSILAASWLVAVPLHGVFARLADTGAGRAMAVIGRGGLVTFIACVLLSIFGDAMQMMVRESVTLKLVADVWVILALWVVGEWLERRARRQGP
ncbi:MAG: OpgC domain-containing protein [Paracoccus sp. (in: a-proteobacteria)]|nr:OpgC domain-containing protein [Paracoccus sp. (in: a-proteobacteria)]